MKDRFTESTMELAEKNPFLCDTCSTAYGHETITDRDEMRVHDHQPEQMGPECMFNCDPMPFGD
jgi:hypothetical protein